MANRKGQGLVPPGSPVVKASQKQLTGENAARTVLASASPSRKWRVALGLTP